MAVILEEITDQNREAVLALRVAPGQERFVSSVEDSLAAAADYPEAGRGTGRCLPATSRLGRSGS
jgi:diamine N-acetyltransferase